MNEEYKEHPEACNVFVLGLPSISVCQVNQAFLTENNTSSLSLKMRLSLFLSVLPLAVAGPTPKRSEPAPLLVPRGVSTSNLVADNYIVKFKPGSALAALEDAMKLIPGQPGQVYNSIFKGFSSHLDAATLDLIRDHPDVSSNWLSEQPAVKLFTNEIIGRVRRTKCQVCCLWNRYTEPVYLGSCTHLPQEGWIQQLRLRRQRWCRYLCLHC